MTPADLVALAEGEGVSLWVNDGALRFRSTRGPIDIALKEKLAAHRALLIEWLSTREREVKTAPLSFNQTRLFVTDAIDTAQSTHNMAVAFRAHFRLPLARIDEAIQAMMGRHEALRTRIGRATEGPLQVVLEPSDPAARVVPIRWDTGPIPALGDRRSIALVSSEPRPDAS